MGGRERSRDWRRRKERRDGGREKERRREGGRREARRGRRKGERKDGPLESFFENFLRHQVKYFETVDNTTLYSYYYTVLVCCLNHKLHAIGLIHKPLHLSGVSPLKILEMRNLCAK